MGRENPTVFNKNLRFWIFFFLGAVWCQGGEGPEGLIRIFFWSEFPSWWRGSTSRSLAFLASFGSRDPIS